MSSSIETLRRMADQIARNVAVRGHEAAVEATVDHISKFWDPRMKAAIFADDRSNLSDIAAEAIERLATQAQPEVAAATSTCDAG